MLCSHAAGFFVRQYQLRKQEWAPKTLLVIAHRLNTIRGADQILVISDGEIAQRGTHQSLMEEDGIYRNFVTVRQQSRGWNRKDSA